MTASKHPFSMTKSKFPKACAAVGLATVLVGCGSGSSSIMMNETPSMDPNPSMDETPSMDPNPSMDPDPTPSMTAEDSLEAALATFERRVNALGNYSTDRQEELARASFDTVGDLLEDTSIPDADKVAYEERYRNIEIDLENRVEMKKELMTKNDSVTRLITALDAWGNAMDMNSIDLDLNQDNIVDIMDSDVINQMEKDASTRIAYRTSTDPDMFATTGMMIEDLPEGWEGKSFMPRTDREERLKIFTDRMSGTSESYADNWEDFWGADNNSGTSPTDTRATTGSLSKYFEEESYKHTFGDPNVDILRGATNSSSDDDAAKEVIRIRAGDSSAIHYTDLTISDEDLTENPLKIGINSDAPRPLSAALFGRPVMLSCTVTTEATSGNTPVETNGGGCEVNLTSEGFLKVIHIALNDDGTEIEGDVPAAIQTSLDEEDNVVRLLLTTLQRRNELEDNDIYLNRPDTNYKVMGYWIDKEGTGENSYVIDTFATARYGPAGEPGITDSIGMLEGEATYRGDSFGAYVMNKEDGDNMDLYDGEFKATVRLTADFMETDRRNNDNAFTVEGAIENFESLTSTDDDLTDWTLDLNMSTVNNSDGSFRGTTTGEGNWQGQFYGMDGMDTAENMSDDLPLAAVGDFSGDFGNSNRVVGVFGADKVEE